MEAKSFVDMSDEEYKAALAELCKRLGITDADIHAEAQYLANRRAEGKDGLLGDILGNDLL